jgi:hypothetical protein
MTVRASRRLVGLFLVAVVFVYFRIATRLEQGAIASQAPVVASGDTIRHRVDRGQLMSDVRVLASPAFEGRRASSPGGLKAREWILDRFQTMGLQPVGATGFLERFSFTHHSIKGLLLPGRTYRTWYPDAANVLGMIPGTRPSSRAIVVSAHYDHLGVRDGTLYPGADDNASGVATLLAVAREFSVGRPAHRLVLAAFDGEEEGLRGAHVFVASDLVPVQTIALDVNLDMVSRNDRNEIFAAGSYQSPWLKPLLQDVQRHAGVKILFGHDRPMRKAGAIEDWTEQSDHGAFAEAGVPFLYFGVEDHADYHQPSDTADKIDPRFFGDVADMVVEAVRTLDGTLP